MMLLIIRIQVRHYPSNSFYYLKQKLFGDGNKSDANNHRHSLVFEESAWLW